jgi:hypothetical protein
VGPPVIAPGKQSLWHLAPEGPPEEIELLRPVTYPTERGLEFRLGRLTGILFKS